MKKIISAFEVGGNYGGGVVTKKLVGYFGVDYFLVARKNNESRLIRYLRILKIWIKNPTLHPIFCAFGSRQDEDADILNFSQTFHLVLDFPEAKFDIICHDIVVQKRLMVNGWVKWTESRIFHSARQIYVLSEKDSRLIRRFYGVPHCRILNLFEKLNPEIESFNVSIVKKNKYRAIFIGSIKRAENYRGLEWFYENIYPACVANIEVVCVGEIDDNLSLKFPEFKFIGYVDSLDEVLLQCDFTIAPVLDGAGIKIKVIDSLARKIPVIGTTKAYEGIGRPNYPHCTNIPEKWIDIINGGRIDYFYRPPV